MRLIILPQIPSDTNGYGIAVRDDLRRLEVNDSDVLIWYVGKKNHTETRGYYIDRYLKISYRRLYNSLLWRPSTEIFSSDISKLPINLDEVDEIFCGDVFFYRALRKLFPTKKINVRFHNCYARIYDRVRLFGMNKHLSLVYRINMKVFYRLEKKIFRDSNTYKIFISDEDRDYYVSHSGKSYDSEVWGFVPDLSKKEGSRDVIGPFNKIVWYGGLDSHKIDSVKWFVSDVFIPLQDKFPWIEFHLYGKGSDAFNGLSRCIFGHGFYHGNDMPFRDEALYINPDLTGGGVKIKLLSYFESGVVFLTTPYGYEGYPRELIDNKTCFVETSEKWGVFLTNFFSKSGKRIK